MKVEILEKNEREMKFLLHGVSPALANELRRIMLSEIPTMAIEWVEFKKNESCLPNEVLANRLGLIPLTFDKRAYSLPSKCKCEGKGCSRCQVKITCKKKGPCMVYSGDLKSDAKDVQPVFDKIPVVELFEGEELQFMAIAQLGVGRTHAKWQGAVVGYKNLPKVTVGRVKDPQKIVEFCPGKVFELKGKELVVKNEMSCKLCMNCVELSEGKIKVEIDENSFIFNVESVSGWKVDELVLESIKILGDKAKEFGKKVGKLKS